MTLGSKRRQREERGLETGPPVLQQMHLSHKILANFSHAHEQIKIVKQNLSQKICARGLSERLPQQMFNTKYQYFIQMQLNFFFNIK